MPRRDPDRSLDTLYTLTLIRVAWVIAAAYAINLAAQLLPSGSGPGGMHASTMETLFSLRIASNLLAVFGCAAIAMVFRRLRSGARTAEGLGLALVAFGCAMSQIHLALAGSPSWYLGFALLLLFAGASFRRTWAYALSMALILGNLLLASCLLWPNPLTYYGVMMAFSTILSLAAHHLALGLNQRSVQLMRRYQAAIGEVRTLRGLIPLCSGCGKLRNPQGGWDRLENHLHLYAGADVTHGLCPECAATMKAQIRELYG